MTLLLIVGVLVLPLMNKVAYAGHWAPVQRNLSYSTSALGYQATFDVNGYFVIQDTGDDESYVSDSVELGVEWIPDYPGEVPPLVSIVYRVEAYAEAVDPNSPNSSVTADDGLGDSASITHVTGTSEAVSSGYRDVTFTGGSGSGTTPYTTSSVIAITQSASAVYSGSSDMKAQVGFKVSIVSITPL